ncbi:MAG TPA: PBP1A family penicillin-binding protein, partial [Longimicrobiaceae bacterium]|nr:PBP1A family penicillin-binding protein [Longimicrobiaceae bacterium]
MKRTLKLAAVVLLVLAVAGFSWLWFAPCGFGGCAPVSELEEYQAEGSELLDVEGRPFGTLATVNRRIVSLDSLPEHLPRAFLAVEDRRFYDHSGVDWARVGGALWSNLRARGVAEGGSTITMQLARNLFPERLPYRERSLRRKVMEIRVARQIERAFEKDKILELYLNHIYLGEGAYGVEAAARAYFGKPAARLTLAEAALLGGLPKSPSTLNPREDRRAALRRRNLVLAEMAKAGYVTPAEAREAIATPLRLAKRAVPGNRRGAWFVERVRRELEERVGDRYYTAGMRVFTTYDPVAQEAAEVELARQADAIEAGGFGAFRHPTYPEAKDDSEEGDTRYLQAMAVVMDAQTGAVRALVGGRDFEDSKFDRAWQALRQAGSAFKPFVYGAALEHGYAPTHRVEDAPIRMVLDGGQVWEPRNYTGTYDGVMTLREALTRSKNTVTVRLAEEIGLRNVIQTARALGIGSAIPNVPATALGAADVRPIELVAAYAAFGNGGVRVAPHFIRRIEDRHGEVVWEEDASFGERVLDPGVAFVLTTLLRDVVDRGTGTAVRAAGFQGPAAGKTGTTNSAADVWFVGYTPELVAGVWYGLDQPRTIVRGASGGTLAAPVWARIMRRIYAARREAPGDWVQPRNVVTEEIDRATGLAVDPACPSQGPTYTEYFVNVRPPRAYCYPDMQYPSLAMDTLYYDYEWGGTEDYDPDTVGLSDLQQRGIDWPELEEMRRRGQTGTTVDGLPAPDTAPLPLPPPPPRPRDPPPATGDNGAVAPRDPPRRREP